jgi:hypothetical protein
MTEEKKKDLKYYRLNAEEDYMYTPISVLRYISELEQQKQPIEQKADMKTKDAERIINELINPSPDLEYIKEVNEIGDKIGHIMERKKIVIIGAGYIGKTAMSSVQELKHDIEIVSPEQAKDMGMPSVFEEKTMERKTSKEILPEEERDCFHMGAKTGRKDYIKALDGELLWKIKLALESAEEEIKFLKKNHAAREESMNHSGDRFLDKCHELAIARNEIEQLKKKKDYWHKLYVDQFEENINRKVELGKYLEIIRSQQIELKELQNRG